MLKNCAATRKALRSGLNRCAKRHQFAGTVYGFDTQLGKAGYRLALCRNLVFRALRQDDSIESYCEENRLIDWFCCKRRPAIDLAHVDLTRCQQLPEQHDGLGLDPASASGSLCSWTVQRCVGTPFGIAAGAFFRSGAPSAGSNGGRRRPPPTRSPRARPPWPHRPCP
jgi:hypothetical protein